MITAKCSGSLGDICYSLCSLKSLNEPVLLYLQPDVKDTIPKSAGTRPPVRMQKSEALALIPLLRLQSYIADAVLWDGERVDFDLDKLRTTGMNLAAGDIARYVTYAYSEFKPVIHEPWLEVPVSHELKGKLIVNRTTRYQNPRINYSFLAERKDCVFVGYETEYQQFSRYCPGLEHRQARCALELARWIKGARGYAGNQSFGWAIAQALGTVPRVLEVYPPAPNCPPTGIGRDAVDQPYFRLFVENLLRVEDL